MKVCFINPCNQFELIGNDPVIIKEQQGVSPPLGILYIAAYLKQTGRYEVSVIDAQADDLTHSQVAERVEQINPDVVGITAMTFTLIDVKMVMDEIRKRVPNTPIVVGGPHVVIYPEESISALGADYAVVGEGEMTMDTLLQYIATEGRNGSKRIWQQEQFIQDLDALPFPARELTNIDKYFSVLCKDTPTSNAFSSRGCPFACSFCDRPALGKGFRAMTSKRVVDEMEWCVNNGIKELMFYDDTFSVSKKRVHDVCNEIKRRGLAWQDAHGKWQRKLGWDVRTRVNVVDSDLLKNMAEAGCERIHFGIESAVPRVIKELAKGITTEQIEDAFALCKQYGIKTLAYFMMGSPTETQEDVDETLRLSRRIDPDFMQMTILSPFPATEIYLRAMREGVIQKDVWREYVNTLNADFRPPLWEEKFMRPELESQLRWFYKRFYLTPNFVIDRVMEVRSFPQFMRYAKAGISLLEMAMVPESKLKDSWRTRKAYSQVGS